MAASGPAPRHRVSTADRRSSSWACDRLGITVAADSLQFSAAARARAAWDSRLGPVAQTAVGFVLTATTILSVGALIRVTGRLAIAFGSLARPLVASSRCGGCVAPGRGEMAGGDDAGVRW
jgi:hypothetical protein